MGECFGGVGFAEAIVHYVQQHKYSYYQVIFLILLKKVRHFKKIDVFSKYLVK